MKELVAERPSPFAPVRPEWLALRREEILEPGLEIIDAHHHLWDRPECPYLLPDLLADIDNGHAVRATVFVECRTRYRRAGDPMLRSLGETEFAAATGEESVSGLLTSARVCAGIVAFADLQAGDVAVEQMLDAHMVAARGRLRGIRNISAWLSDSASTRSSKAPSQGLLLARPFRNGFAHLAPRGLTFDAWMFHTQLSELRDLARAFSETTIVLNHVGGPLGIGRYAGCREQVFADWSLAMRMLASCPNIYVKLGGLGMPLFGFGFHEQLAPPASDEMAAAWRPYIETCIDAFGSERCMFESNFPVDKASYSYTAIWNAFKRITTGCSKQERDQLFAKTAAKVYRLDV